MLNMQHSSSPHGLGSPTFPSHYRDRTPSLGEIHQQLEQEQEAQVVRQFNPACLRLLMEIGLSEPIAGHAEATTSRAAGYARPGCFGVSNNSSEYGRNDSSNRTINFQRIPSKRTFLKFESGHRFYSSSTVAYRPKFPRALSTIFSPL